MIIFDLRCGAGHVFEAWFGSSGDYEGQQARGLVSCPICGSGEVGKAVMAPRLGVASAAEEDADSVKAMMTAMAAVQKKMLEASNYVGERFAEEARSIHLGEAEARSIHGRATPQQARSLAEEGIQVTPLPFPVTAPDQEN